MTSVRHMFLGYFRVEFDGVNDFAIWAHNERRSGQVKQVQI